MKKFVASAAVTASLVGCGSTGISSQQLVQSVADSGRALVSRTKREFIERGGHLALRTTGSEELLCPAAHKWDSTPTGTTAKYACFWNAVRPGGSRAETIFYQVNVYSINGNCWQGVVSTEESGVGTPGFYETRPSQAELNSKNWNVHGCIGQHPTPTPTTATQPTEHPKEQSVAEAPPSATLTFVKGLSHPPGVEPKQLEIGGGSQPFYLASIHWSDWGRRTAVGTGTFRFDTCTPDCAAAKYAAFPATVRLSHINDSCGETRYRNVSLTTNTEGVISHRRFRLKCSGLAK